MKRRRDGRDKGAEAPDTGNKEVVIFGGRFIHIFICEMLLVKSALLFSQFLVLQHKLVVTLSVFNLNLL